MLFTLTADAVDPDVPATGLGFLLHKHPDRVNTTESSVGTARVFYPENSAERCTVALLLEVDPVAGVRGTSPGPTGGYLDDRPYSASSLLAVALGRVFSTALARRCTAHPELVDVRWPLVVRLPAVPCRGGEDAVRRFFEPLGWEVAVRSVLLDETRPDWGTAEHLDVQLSGTHVVADALAHLCVLLPVLDDAKHYWIGEDEVDKLLRRGGSWLAGHPHSREISSRYLKHRRALVDDAVARLDPEHAAEPALEEETPRTPLREERRTAILEELRTAGAASVADLGCGQGQLLARLLDDPQFSRVVGTDVSARAVQQTARRLHLDRMPEPVRARLDLFQSSLLYRDDRIAGLDAVVLSEVVEHVDEARLPTLERVLFGEAHPATVLVSTPNAEFNVNYPDLTPGTFRHPDHRFEWTREEFAAWAQRVGDTFGYRVRFRGIGPVDDRTGTPTQLAVFSR